MAEVKVLIEGYVREVDGKEFASSTITLIQDSGLNIIVDPGMDRKELLSSLEKENLSLDQINYVVLTHNHLDHSLLAGIFENAKILDDTDIYSFDGEIDEHEGKIPGTEIQIIKTPGHDQFHCSVLVNTEKLGRVVIAGDVFWWADNEEQKTDRESLLSHEDPYVKNKEELEKSRKKVLELADYIVPGHAGIYKVSS